MTYQRHDPYFLTADNLFPEVDHSEDTATFLNSVGTTLPAQPHISTHTGYGALAGVISEFLAELNKQRYATYDAAQPNGEEAAIAAISFADDRAMRLNLIQLARWAQDGSGAHANAAAQEKREAIQAYVEDTYGSTSQVAVECTTLMQVLSDPSSVCDLDMQPQPA